MRNRILNGHRSPIKHYGVLAVLVIILFSLGLRMGSLLIQQIQPSQPEAALNGAAAQVEPPVLVQNFTLTSQTGLPISLSDLRGKPMLMFFGYTHCPEECPLTIANYTRVKDELREFGDNVHFVFVSVDGERDSPQVMAEFLQNFDDSFIGMTGEPTHLRQLGAQFGLLFEKVVLGNDGVQRTASEQDENYFVSHISPSFLIDKNGYLTRVFFYGTKPDVIADNLRPFLQMG